MGWRANEAYERAQRDDYRRWRASLTWPEYLSFHFRRCRHVLAGAAVALVAVLAVRWLLG